MIPETSHANQVRLYSTSQYPLRWRVVRVLLSGKPFVDPTVFEHAGRWYMFVTLRGATSFLYLYTASSLVGPWIEHPQSPVVRADQQFGRPAGLPIVDNAGRLIRWAQDGRRMYGEAVYGVHILNLTETAYAERLLNSAPLVGPVAGSWHGYRAHHVSFHRLPELGNTWLSVVDGH